MARFNYGGQALIEGVLMRGRNAIAVAFRHPDGHIVWAAEPLNSGPHGWRLAGAPFVRGLIVLYETLVVGTKWLIRSANVQVGEDEELGKGTIALMLGFTLLLGLGVFFLLPLLIATFTTANVEDDLAQHLLGNACAPTPVDPVVGQAVGDEGPEPVVDAGELPACLIDMG